MKPNDERLMAPEFVLQEAREMFRFQTNEKKPYTAGVIGDCIATIETLQAQLAALASTPSQAVQAEAGIIERCAKIALAIDSGRGNEKEIATAIRRLASAATSTGE